MYSKVFIGILLVVVVGFLIFIGSKYYEFFPIGRRVPVPQVLSYHSHETVRGGDYGILLEAVVKNVGPDGWVKIKASYEDNEGKSTHQKQTHLQKNEVQKLQFFFSEPTVLGSILTLSFKYKTWVETYSARDKPKLASFSEKTFRGYITRYFVDSQILPPPRDLARIAVYGEDTTRVFITPNDSRVVSWIKSIKSPSVKKLSELVNFNVKYKSDLEVHGKRDYWQLPAETIKLGSGDCEDQAFLLASLARVAGYTEEEVFVAVGKNHAWVMVKEEKTWQILEPTADGWKSYLEAGFKGASWGGLLGALIGSGVNPILGAIVFLVGAIAINEGVDYFIQNTLPQDVRLMCNDEFYYGRERLEKQFRKIIAK